MQVTVPLAGLKTTTVHALEPGSFFYSIPEGQGSRDYYLRAESGNSENVAVVRLDDVATPPSASFARNGQAQVSRVLHVPAENLHFRLGLAGPERGGDYVAGNLVVTADDALIIVRIPGMGGSFDIGYVSTSTWTVQRDHPVQYAMFTSWQILSRQQNRDEVMYSFGPEFA